MAEQALSAVIDHIRRIPGCPRDTTATDHELLRAFCEKRDESAFATLMHRHGPMVRDVCRRLLGRDSETDDAMQAVFLVLAQRGGTIRKRQSLASWLFGVTYRVCQRARRDGARRRTRETRAAKSIECDVEKEETWRELSAALDAELMKMPEKYRAPLVHCYLQGQTRDRAAVELQLSLRTLDRRLESGRAMLRRRLERCGLTLSAALLAGALSQTSAEAAMEGPLIQATIRAAPKIAAGAPLAIEELSAGTVALTKTIGKSASLTRLKLVALLFLAAALTTGAAKFALHAADRPGEVRTIQAELPIDAPVPKAKSEEPKLVDLIGDALPPGAIARLGSTNWQIQGELADCMVVTNDGKNLATADRADGVAWWNMTDGLVAARIPAPAVREKWFPAHSIALSDGARRAAIADRNSTVHVLDLPSGAEVASYTFDAPVLELALSKNGSMLAARFKDGALFLWNLGQAGAVPNAQPREKPWQIQAKRKQEGDWRAKPPFPSGELAFSPDSELFAWAGQESGRPTHLYDIATRKESAVFGKYRGDHRYIAFSADGSMLASTSDLSLGEVWHIATGKAVVVLPKGWLWSAPIATFSLDGKALALKVPAVGVSVIEIPSGKSRWSVPDNRLRIPRQDVFAFTPDSRTLLFNSYDPINRRYDAKNGNRILRPGEQTAKINELAFSRDGKYVYSLSSDSTLRKWETKTGRQIHETAIDASSGGRFTSDGRHVAGVSRTGTTVCDADTGERLWHSPENRLFCTSDDGTLIALNSGADVVIRDFLSGKELQRWCNVATIWSEAAISPDNCRVYVNVVGPGGSRPAYLGQLQIWDINSGSQLPSITFVTNRTSMRLSPDGKAIAIHAVEKDFGRIELREVLTGQTRLVCTMPDSYSLEAHFSFTPDGNFLATGDVFGKYLDFYDLNSGRRRFRLFSCSSGISCWAISRDGKHIATAGEGANAVIWDYACLRLPSPDAIQSSSDPATLWDDLASPDAAKAYQAIHTMIAAPDRTLPYLAAHLSPAPAADAKQTQAWISKLGSSEYAVRERATVELEKCADSTRSILEESLKKELSPEAAQRIRRVLSKVALAPELIRSVRAVEVLEHIGSPEARRILQRLADGVRRALLTEEAKASLERLAQRSAN